jgi:phosphoribosylamine---glycine ligase
LPVTLDPSLSQDEMRRLHLVEVARDGHGQLVTSGITGFVGVVTGVGESVTEAQEQAYALARKIYVPNLRYRTDIGQDFLQRGRRELQRLGYLPAP